MAYYTRNRYSVRRRRRGYWRRSRHSRRRRYPFRRKPHRGLFRRRKKTEPVRQTVPRRRKAIIVRGWEPLGNVCTSDTAKNRATPYCSLEPNKSDCANSAQWHGTYGYHYHTLENLIKRAYYRWNRWSSNWETYDYIKFCGGYAYLPPNEDLNWMFNAQPYWLSTHFVDQQKNGPSNEETWAHPGYLLHAKGTTLVWSRRLRHHTKLQKVKIPVPETWEGWIPIKNAPEYVLWFWVWSWWDPQRAFFNPCFEDTSSSCAAEPWWAKDQSWVNRDKYQAANQASLKNWGPYLPSKQCSGNPASLWFLYELKFKVGGQSIWSEVPRDPAVQGYIPSAPSLNGPSGQIQPYSGDPHRGDRPWSTYDILPPDLEEGILSDEALARITRGDEGGPPPLKRRRVGPHQRRRRGRSAEHKLRNIRLLVRRILSFHAEDADQN